jgi:hypothetical protein
LGEIEDLAIDSQTGQIRYAVLSFGGFMGIGDKLFAVPWTAFTKRDNDTYALSIDKSRLERAPGFDKNNWPDMADQQWGREVHAFYNVQPYWEPRDRYTRGTRTGEYDFDRGEFAQHSARNMTFARALEQNDFELTDAIKKAENHTNGQAVSAHCLFASATTRTSDRNMDYDSPDDERTERSYGRTGEGEEVNVEVAIFTPGDTQNLRIVTISPRTGEVLRTRGAPLPTSGTRSDAGHDRGKMAEGN